MGKKTTDRVNMTINNDSLYHLSQDLRLHFSRVLSIIYELSTRADKDNASNLENLHDLAEAIETDALKIIKEMEEVPDGSE